ncbi:MAG: polyphosphate polymerase domain-containing protein [Thioploca sp.]|nr:polyphosphate polymerase domain-containing protein [Thioploca sp.]
MMLPDLFNSNREIITFPAKNQAIYFQECLELNRSLTPFLQDFPSYALHELSNANLMNRFDTKYLLPLYFLPEILTQLQMDYSILEIDSRRIFTYQNIYFDTDNFQFYYMHHNGKLNRFKVRHRQYLETQTDFLEVKFKNNHRQTIKTRMKISTDPNKTMTEKMTDFLQQQLPGTIPTSLYSKQLVRYQRITLANEQLGERITLDFCLWFQPTEGEFLYALDGIFIVELKQARKILPLPCLN